jgi:hypothetical protein
MADINKCFTYLIMSLCLISAYAEANAEEHTSGQNATLSSWDRPNADNDDDENRLLQEKKQSVVIEAASAVQACEIASKSLNEGDLTQARGYIELAKQKLTDLKTSMPGVDVIPIDAKGKLSHLNTDVRRLKALQTKIKQLIASNNFQAARPLIDMMADEMRVRMVLLPISQFMGEVQTISELMGTGYINRAKAHLHDAMNELVVREEMVPVPILRAEELVSEASTLNLNRGLSTASNSDIHEMIAAALEQLKIAEMLGYGASQDFAEMSATARLMSREKNTGRFLSESRHFLEETTDFKYKHSYMATDVNGHDALPARDGIRNAAQSISF